MQRIVNVKIVTPEGILQNNDCLIRDGRIHNLVAESDKIQGNWEEVDGEGGYLMPGFIDIHADYIEHIAAPRPTSMMDFSLSLHEAERELITHGITTMYHSLSLYKSQMFDTKPIRRPENVQKLVELINQAHSRKHLIRHRFHARYEIDNLDMIDVLREYIMDRKIHMVSFMDHTPGQGQYRDLEMFRKTIKGYRNLSDEQVDVMVLEQQKTEKVAMEKIRELSQLAREKGLAVASHDDDTVDKVDLVQSFGTTISEFPITLEVARYAHKKGMHTVAGAPNVLLGGSHAGNLSAAEAILDGSVDILCSDYYPASMIHAVFKLHEEKGVPLHEAVKLVTLNPAKAVHADDQVGSIEPGKKADLLIVQRLEDHFPAVTTAMVNGISLFQTRYRKG